MNRLMTDRLLALFRDPLFRDQLAMSTLLGVGFFVLVFVILPALRYLKSYRDESERSLTWGDWLNLFAFTMCAVGIVAGAVYLVKVVRESVRPSSFV